MLNGLQRKDHFAGDLARLERLDGLGGALEGITGMNVWFQAPICNPGQNLGHVGAVFPSAPKARRRA